MHRAPILALLRAHVARPLDPSEAAMAAEIIRFVEAHPDCLHRSCVTGHLTGSAWIVSPDRTRALLTHHRKLDRWLQLGGHADGDGDLAAVARREAHEESGLAGIRLVAAEIFDCDRHEIPARGAEPAHWHLDVRFLFEASPAEPLVISSESKDLAWVELDGIRRLSAEESLARMVRKTRAGAD